MVLGWGVVVVGANKALTTSAATLAAIQQEDVQYNDSGELK